MQRINPGFWAKKEDKLGYFTWLPLSQHLEDTRRVSGLLWEHWLSSSQRRLLTDALEPSSEDLAKRVVQFLGAIHDMGKATPAFQCRSNGSDLDAALREKLEGAGFGDISALRLPSVNKTHHSLAGQTLLASFGVGEDIASIIGGHHGRPIDSKEACENQRAFAKNYFQVENKTDPIHHKWHEEQQIIFQWALEANGFTQVEELPKVKQPGQVILSGLLIMADWIASNTSYFPLISIEKDAIANQRDRISEAWARWAKGENWDPQSSEYALGKYNNINQLYRERFDFENPRNIQSVFAEVIRNTKNPGIFILEAPMGEGKTEAALVGAEVLAWKTGSSGIFFGLPTQATSNGIFPRIEEWLQHISGETLDSETPFSPRLIHGKAAFNETESLRNGSEKLAECIDLDGSTKGSLQVNEWFSGRKTANLDDFVVGTVDQFLMLALKQKHLALRHLGFTRKVIIIDEVHAYDAYMSQYLYMSVTWMAAYGVPVIILSATLPADKREQLVKSYMNGMGLNWKRDVIQPQQGLQTDAYPLITYSDSNHVTQVDDFEPPSGKEVEIKCLDQDNLPDLIQRLYREGGVIGIIVNTVKQAQELAKNCIERYGGENVELLHSRFIAMNRITKEKNLLEMIGKGATRPKKKIIIGTQVIEQSLDIDFDVMISELAPMDLLIQRVGRLHRHPGTIRPDNHQNPVLYVLGTNETLDFGAGSQAVYGDYLLARTQAFLPETLSIPEDISALVQQVYDNEVPVLFQGELQKKYEKMKMDQEQRLSNKGMTAQIYRIDKPVVKESRRKSNSLIGWLKHTHPGETEEQVNAQVRDSNETIEVIALKKVGDGYGLFSSTEDISHLIDQPAMAKEVAKHTVNLPGILSAPYRIDSTIRKLEEYNGRELKIWQQQYWLKGGLGIIFGEDSTFTVNGVTLHYDMDYGLSYEELENGEI